MRVVETETHRGFFLGERGEDAIKYGPKGL